MEKREKGLIEQIAGYKERESEAQKKEEQYEKLLERYRGQYKLSVSVVSRFSGILGDCT